jgi:hypothetical protein
LPQAEAKTSARRGRSAHTVVPMRMVHARVPELRAAPPSAQHFRSLSPFLLCVLRVVVCCAQCVRSSFRRCAEDPRLSCHATSTRKKGRQTRRAITRQGERGRRVWGVPDTGESVGPILAPLYPRLCGRRSALRCCALLSCCWVQNRTESRSRDKAGAHEEDLPGIFSSAQLGSPQCVALVRLLRGPCQLSDLDAQFSSHSRTASSDDMVMSVCLQLHRPFLLTQLWNASPQSAPSPPTSHATTSFPATLVGFTCHHDHVAPTAEHCSCVSGECPIAPAFVVVFCRRSSSSYA